MKKFKNSRLSTDSRKLQTLALKFFEMTKRFLFFFFHQRNDIIMRLPKMFISVIVTDLSG